MAKNVIIIDAQDITNIGMRYLVEKTEKAVSINSASNKNELIKLLIAIPDSLVILDYTLSDFSSADELLNVSLRFQQSRWLLFSDELSSDFLKHLIFVSNSFSVVLKTSDVAELEMAIIHSSRNERFICSRVTNQLLLADKSASSKTENILTNTETEILKEMALGNTTKEIAAKRNLSFHTIITHRKNIFRKLDVNNVHEATKYAMRAGIIDIAEYYI